MIHDNDQRFCHPTACFRHDHVLGRHLPFLYLFQAQEKSRGPLLRAVVLHGLPLRYFLAGLYDSSSVAEGARWQRAQVATLALIAITFMWFIADYTKLKSRKLITILSIYYLLSSIGIILDRTNLTYTDVPSIKQVQIAFLPVITYFETTPGPLISFQTMVGVTSFVYLFYITLGFYRAGNEEKAKPLFWAMLLFFAGLLNDSFVSLELYSFIYVLEYSYLGMVLLMAYTISNTVIEAAIAKEELSVSRERLESALRGADLGLWDWDVTTGKITINDRWAEMLGYTVDEIEPNEDLRYKMIHPDDNPRLQQNLQNHLNGLTPFYVTEYRMRSKSGGWVWILDTGKAVERDEDGNPLRVAGTHIDLTERKEAEDEIKRKNIELEAALKIKSEFISMVSHELRTPLVPIQGYAELLVDGSFGEMPVEAIEPLEFIKSRSQDLSQIINDLILFSSMEFDKLSLKIETISSRSFVTGVAREYLNRDHGKPVMIEWSGDDINLRADKIRLQQILRNLIDNSIKYSDDSVEITINSVQEDNMCLISVTDNGIGIAGEHIPHIFERFYQVEDVSTRTRGGAGLGLAIIKELTEIMDGKISVESEPGVGSTFTVALHLADSR